MEIWSLINVQGFELGLPLGAVLPFKHSLCHGSQALWSSGLVKLALQQKPKVFIG